MGGGWMRSGRMHIWRGWRGGVSALLFRLSLKDSLSDVMNTGTDSDFAFDEQAFVTWAHSISDRPPGKEEAETYRT